MALVNDFVLGCDWTPNSSNVATLLDSGDVSIYYDGTNISMIKGAAVGSMVFPVVAGTTYSIKGRISSTQGVDIFAEDVKGTNDADVSDATPSAILQIGCTEALTEHINGNIKNVFIVKGDLDNDEVIALP